MTEDKAAAYTTLYTVLTTLAKLTAPYTPFISEMIYQNLVAGLFPAAPKSVHLCAYPQAEEEYIDKELEKAMEQVQNIVVLGRAARNAGNLKNRQPLAKMFVVSEKDISLSEEEQSIVLDELNVREFKVAEDAELYITYKLKPQLKTLGPKYGKLLSQISQFLATCNAKEVVTAVKNGGSYTIPETDITLLYEDLQIFTESANGFVAAEDNGVTVALDCELTEELILEGVERELVSKIQNMRKEAGFEVTDRIEIYYKAEGRSLTVLKRASFAPDVLAEKVAAGIPATAPSLGGFGVIVLPGAFTRDLSVNGDAVRLTILKRI